MVEVKIDLPDPTFVEELAAKVGEAEDAYYNALVDYARTAFLAANPLAGEEEAGLFVDGVLDITNPTPYDKVHNFFDRVREALEDFEAFRKRDSGE